MGLFQNSKPVWPNAQQLAREIKRVRYAVAKAWRGIARRTRSRALAADLGVAVTAHISPL